MEMCIEEMMKIFDFLIENKELIISNNGFFSFNTLKIIRDIVKGKIPNDFKLTEEQEKLIIESFINGNQVFNEETPSFLLMNDSCIKASIDRDINSIDFSLCLPSNLEDYIIEKAKKEHYILKKDSFDRIKSCYEIALNSIKCDVKSANFVLWKCISEEKRKILEDELIKNGYVLSKNSADFLTKNKRIVFRSIQKNLYSFCYADSSMKENYQIIRYLLLHGYEFQNSEIEEFPLKILGSSEFMKHCLKKTCLDNSTDEKYINRISELYSDALKKLPSIHSFESIFEASAESSWKQYRKINSRYYDNIFGIICAELKSNTDLEDALEELSFLDNIERTLGKEKYQTLNQAMEDYFNIFHNEADNQLAKIQKSKNVIAELSSLYVSKAKEKYKKKKLQDYYEWIYPYFTLRTDHPMIKKKLILLKQKETFEHLYNSDDKDINEFLENLVQKYDRVLDRKLINKMIYCFILYNANTIDQIIWEPDYYSYYVRYEKATKLIRRLNSNFIEYDGVEMTNYHDIISYNEVSKEYVYSGMIFDQQKITEFEDYRKKSDIFEKIKKEIISKVKEMKVNDSIDEDQLEIKKLKKELPFTDEYFIFDLKNLKDFNLRDLLAYACLDYELHEDNFKSPSVYHNIYQLLVNQGMIWLLLFMKNDKNDNLFSFGVNTYDIVKLINNMNGIVNLSKRFHSNLTNFKELLLLNEMSHYTLPISLAILGNEVIEKISKYRSYTDHKIEVIISMATELVAQMVKRNKSTVPYIQGETDNYRYSLYDSQDETVLLTGIYTDACFRVDGNDNDFLHYCALDKNGFVIKITDYYNHFIARASGFRNGNCIFINQLRTIYDRCGNDYRGNYTSEQNEIIETFKKACENIVTISGQNNQEVDKIEYVFVTKSYSLKDYSTNVCDSVIEEIGDAPMDNDSEDWKKFVENTKNLQRCYDCFTTDYGDYELICMASIKEPEEISPKDIKPKNVDALYERKRTPIIVTNQIDESIMRKIDKIRGIKLYLEEKECELIEIPKQSVILTGDNWYIIYNNGEIVDFCVLDFDKKAKIEFKATSIILKEKKINNNLSHLDIAKMIGSMQIDEEDDIKIKELTIFK